MKKERGVTIISLTITVVILILLSSVTIATLNGNTGLFEQAKKAKNDVEIDEGDKKGRIENYITKIDGFKEDQELDIDITFEQNIEEWTKEEVEVTASIDIEGYSVFTSIDGENWQNTNKQTLKENGIVYARPYDGEKYGIIQEYEVTNIDTEKPVITGVTVTSGNIKITASDEISGIVGYAITTNTKTPTSFNVCENTNTLVKTLEGNAQGTTYYLWVIDATGNISNYKSVNT